MLNSVVLMNDIKVNISLVCTSVQQADPDALVTCFGLGFIPLLGDTVGIF